MQPTLLQPTDPLTLAYHKLFFDVPDTSSTEPGARRTIIHSLSGVIQAGEFSAIMGPSGCGKSTLMDMVAGVKTAEYSGIVYVNGHERERNRHSASARAFKRAVGYCPQEVVSHGKVTTRESLEFYARLRPPVSSQLDLHQRLVLKGSGLDPSNPSDVSISTALNLPLAAPLTQTQIDAVQRRKLVDLVLAAIDLTQHAESYVGDQNVRGLSGGQKKRMSIGRALVTGPAVLFLDEPTTGLSATDAHLVIEHLKELCTLVHITCLSVIHQPRHETFELFDNLTFLVNGHAAYQGPGSEAAAYFGAISPDGKFSVPADANPADHFLDVISPGREARGADPELFVRSFNHAAQEKLVQQSLAKQGRRLADSSWIELAENSPRPPNRLEQFWVVLGRELTVIRRQPGRVVGSAQYALISGIIAIVQYAQVDPEFVGFFGFVANPTFATWFTMAITFSDRARLNEERSAGLYSSGVYFAVSTVVKCMILSMSALICTLVSWTASGLPFELWPGFLLSVLVSLFATLAITDIVAYASPDEATANAYFSATLGILFTFNGLSVNRNTSPQWLQWLLYISPRYLALEIFLNDLADSAYSGATQVRQTLVGTGVGQLGMEDGVVTRDYLISLGIWLFATFVAFLCMSRLNRVVR